MGCHNIDAVSDKNLPPPTINVYDPDFCESIAVDARIKGLSKMLELEFDNYADHEQFYLDVAKEAGLTGWELDRLLFNFREEVLEGLKG